MSSIHHISTASSAHSANTHRSHRRQTHFGQQASGATENSTQEKKPSHARQIVVTLLASLATTGLGALFHRYVGVEKLEQAAKPVLDAVKNYEYKALWETAKNKLEPVTQYAKDKLSAIREYDYRGALNNIKTTLENLEKEGAEAAS